MTGRCRLVLNTCKTKYSDFPFLQPSVRMFANIYNKTETVGMGRGWISIFTQVCAEKVMKHKYHSNGGSMSIFMNEYKRAFIEEDKKK
jgi:hypothetical protein